MKSTIPKTHLFIEEDLHLFDLPQIFTASSLWFEEGMQDHIATFDLMVRDMPPHRNFLLFGGLEEILEGLRKWSYTQEEIGFLLERRFITPKFAKYLKNFKFTGSVHALPEGTLFFNNEPIVRITAPLVQANLFTMFLMNVATGNTKFLSKVIRPVIASAPKVCLGVAGLRADSFESAMKCARAAYIAGTVGSNSVSSFSRKFNLEAIAPITVVYHAVIKSFPTEIEAMRKMSELFQGKVSLMVDTYDFNQGIKNAITVAKELKRKGIELQGIMIDSGDLLNLCLKARKMLDDAGLKKVKITIASNLDEYKIKDYMDKNIPVDSFIIATEAITVPDAPKLETVYKLSELRAGNTIKYCAKFAPGKESYPGRKQVYRIYKKNIMVRDIIGLDDEKLGEPLLIEVIKNGKLVYPLPNLDQIKEHIKSQLKTLPKKLLDINKQHTYPVEISPKLKNLFQQVKKEHCNNEVQL